MNEEALRRIAFQIEEAADKATRAADRIEEASRRIAFLLEDGYGGNGVKLLEALERLELEGDPQKKSQS